VSSNPILALEDTGFERDTGRSKIGDGVKAWNDLNYFNEAPAGGGGPAIVQPSCKIRQTVVQSIPSAAFTPLLMNSEDWDPSGMHDLAVNTSRVTITQAGIYLVTGQMRFAYMNGGLQRQIAIMVNGVVQTQGVMKFATDISHILDTFSEFALIAGDYVQLAAFQDTTGAVNTVGGATHFTVRRVGDTP
jgi:hypothetical protein